MAETRLTRDRVVRSGIGTIYFAPREVVDADTPWEEVLQSTRDSVVIAQEQGDATEIFVDQLETAVSVKYGTGSFSINLSTPDVAPELLAYFFDTEAGSFAPAGLSSIKVSSKLNILEKMVRFDWAEGGSFIITNAQIVATFSKEGDGPMSLDLSITALAAGGTGVEDKEFIFWS